MDESKSEVFNHRILLEQGQIHGNPVADGWAGAAMQKPLGNSKM